MNIVNAVAFHTLFQIIKRAFLPVSQLQIYTASLNDAIIVSTSYIPACFAIGYLRLSTLGLPYVFLLEDMSSFSAKNDLSSEDLKKCPNVFLFRHYEL